MLKGMGKRGPKQQRKEIIWSADLSYAIGLIATDGCLSSNGRHLTLVSKDREQVENLKKCLQLDVKIGNHISGFNRPGERYYRIQWGDVQFYNFLLAIGLTPRKSTTIPALDIPDEYFFDFLRGSFDGDGSLYAYFDKRWRSSFMLYINFTSASRAHITWLRSTLERLLGVVGHVVCAPPRKDSHHEVLTLRYAKREGLRVLKRMYYSEHATALSRKRLKINEALRIVNESLL